MKSSPEGATEIRSLIQGKLTHMHKLLTLPLILMLGSTAFAQGFPWEIFKARTLKEVISITTKAVRPDDSMFLANNQLESKVQVTFTGQSRPIIESRKTFIRMWVGMLRADQKDYAELYEREYLYKEGSDEYWLATLRRDWERDFGAGRGSSGASGPFELQYPSSGRFADFQN